VKELRRLRARGWKLKQLARRYDVGVSVVSHICRGDFWKHVGGIEESKRVNMRVRGERSNHAKLTAEQVREIRRRRAAGEKAIDLAREYGVRRGNIFCIVTRKTWRHLED
jgi:hypothetical protein